MRKDDCDIYLSKLQNNLGNYSFLSDWVPIDNMKLSWVAKRWSHTIFLRYCEWCLFVH